jgi:hypothetical protein
MKIVKIFVIMVFPIIIVGCSSVLGIKEPTKISKKSTIEYLNKHNISTKNVVFLKDNYFDTLRTLAFKPNWAPGLRPIQFKVFNANGRLISQYSSCEGPLKNTLFKDTFPPINLSPIDTSYTLHEEQRLITDSLKYNKSTDYIVILYWATYTGVIGRRFLIKTEKHFKANGNNIKIYKLNTDNIIKK